MIDEESLQRGWLRLQQIFQYLKALNERRNPPVRRVEEHPCRLWLSDLPEHECAQSDVDGAVLRVTRPRKTDPPPPPEPLLPWLQPGWDAPEPEPKVRESLPPGREDDEPELFEATAQRVPSSQCRLDREIGDGPGITSLAALDAPGRFGACWLQVARCPGRSCWLSVPG